MAERDRETPPAMADLVQGCEEPDRLVSLPEAVRIPLGLNATETRSASLRAAVTCLGELPQRRLRSIGGEEVVYQAFLGPFLGFTGECGTFSSFVCHLPFLLQELKVTTILLLPILRRGQARKKGRSGSPFAIYDHRSIEAGLNDFSVSYEAEEVWRLLVTECRRLGVRLGMILPLATLAMDAPAIRDKPSIAFWWRADPGELLTGEPVEGSTSLGAEAPPVSLREATPAGHALHRFAVPPRPGAVRVVDRDGSDLFTARDRSGERISVANAYPDPIAGADAKYTWRDVAAIRYEESLVPRRYRQTKKLKPNIAAEKFLSGVLRHRIDQDGDAFLVDVSSAIPDRILAREFSPYPENMLVAEQLWEFRDRRPFEFVTGPLIPCVAAHARAPELLAESLAFHLELLRQTGEDASWFFGGLGNHDTVPCPRGWQRALLMLFCLLPRSVPFLYSGTEFGSQIPTNEEFGDLGGGVRTPEDQLLLFSQRPVRVNSSALGDFVGFWKDLMHLRARMGIRDMSPVDLGLVERNGPLVSVEIGDMLAVINCSPSRETRLGAELTSRVHGRTAISTAAVAADRDGLVMDPRTTALFVTGEVQPPGGSFVVTRVGPPVQTSAVAGKPVFA